MNKKVVIIGCGNVGISYAYSLIHTISSIHEIVLIDVNQEKAEGEALDLSHALTYAVSSPIIRIGNYTDCFDASIVCITAGVSQSHLKSSRMDDLYTANDILKSIIDPIMQSGFSGIFLLASNPLDVMTYMTWKYSGMDKNKIVGSGTCLDTARLKTFLANKLEISPKAVDAYVVGEHGDSQFVAWDSAHIGMEHIGNYLSDNEKNEIEAAVRNSGYLIVQKKGYTCFGIASALTRITKAILDNENTILCVSSYDNIQQVYISTPTLLNENGVIQSGIMNLSAQEVTKFENSANIIKEAIHKLETK